MKHLTIYVSWMVSLLDKNSLMSCFNTAFRIISFGYNRSTLLIEIIFFSYLSNLPKIFRKKDGKFIHFSKNEFSEKNRRSRDDCITIGDFLYLCPPFRKLLNYSLVSRDITQFSRPILVFFNNVKSWKLPDFLIFWYKGALLKKNRQKTRRPYNELSFT